MKKKVSLLFLTISLVFLKCNFVLAATYDNYEKNAVVKCGGITDIPVLVPKVTSIIITTIQIAVPVILVIMGMLDLAKGIMAQKEDEIKKGQQIFIKRLISATLVFFVVVAVKFVVSLAADSSKVNIVECIDCFISNDCKRQGLSGIMDESEELIDDIIDGVNDVTDTVKDKNESGTKE